MKVDLIIVDYNVGKLIKKCLESCLNNNNKKHINKVVIIDNNSKIPTNTYLTNIDLPIVYIRNEKNVGFGAACNKAAKACRAEYLLFLNPDTQLTPNSLEIPVCFFDENKDVSIAGIQLINDDGSIAFSCARFSTLKHFYFKMLGLSKWAGQKGLLSTMSDWDHKNNKIVNIVMGAFIFIRRVVFENLKGFDERFFLYFDETDLFYRSHRAGYKTIYLANSQAFHSGEGSTKNIKSQRLFYSLRSRILFVFKHYSIINAVLLLIATLFIEPLARCFQLIVNKMIIETKEVFDAYIMLIKDMPSIVKTIINHYKKDKCKEI